MQPNVTILFSPGDTCSRKPMASPRSLILCPVAVAIAKSVDSYLATSIARLLYDSRDVIPESLIYKDL